MSSRLTSDEEYNALLRYYDLSGPRTLASNDVARILREYGNSVPREVAYFLALLKQRSDEREARAIKGSGSYHEQRSAELASKASSGPRSTARLGSNEHATKVSVGSGSGTGFTPHERSLDRVSKASTSSRSSSGSKSTRYSIPSEIRSNSSFGSKPPSKLLSIVVDNSSQMSLTWDEVKHSVVKEIATARAGPVPVRLSLRLVATEERVVHKFSKEADRMTESVSEHPGSTIIDGIGHEIDSVNSFLRLNPQYKDNAEILIYTMGGDTASKKFTPVAQLAKVIQAAKGRGFLFRVMHCGARVFADELGLVIDPNAVREPSPATRLVLEMSGGNVSG